MVWVSGSGSGSGSQNYSDRSSGKDHLSRKTTGKKKRRQWLNAAQPVCPHSHRSLYISHTPSSADPKRIQCVFQKNIPSANLCIIKAEDANCKNALLRSPRQVEENLNALHTSSNISLKPQVWLWLILTWLWYPQICFIPLSQGKRCFLLRYRSGGSAAINHSERLRHTAQLAALTWYITQAVAAPHTPPSSREFPLQPWFCRCHPPGKN